MINKEQCLKILKTLSAIEGILRSHAKTSTIPDYIWDEITDIAETLSEEILGPVATPVVLPDPDFLQRHEDVCGDEVGPPTAFYTAATVRNLLAAVSTP